MKQRVVTGLVGITLFFIIMAFYNTIIFDIIVCAISIIAVHELLLATKVTKSVLLSTVSMILSIVPFVINVVKLPDSFKITIYFAAIALMLIILLKEHNRVTFSQVASAFFIAIAIPFAFSSLIWLRNDLGMESGIYCTLLVFACAWGSDTGAYFAGKFFGKRKLAPNISPNKTVEGLIGGVISCLIFVTLVTVGYYFVMDSLLINPVILLILSIAGSLMGVLGDLSASIIKRQFSIKDFGSILPGHGGVMDRFDSALFISPFFYIALQYIN